MTFPPPHQSPNDPPAPGQWQPSPQPPYAQPNPQPNPQYAQPNPQFAPYGQQPSPEAPAQAPSGQPMRMGWQPAEPVPPAPAPGRGWVVPTVVVVSLLAIVGVFAASAVRESEDATTAADLARDAVVRLTDAMVEGDCAGVEDASTGGYFRAMNLTCEDIAFSGEWMSEAGVSFVVGEADVDGGTAKVPVDLVVTSDPSQSGSGYFTVVRTGESWRVSNDQMS